MSCRFARGIRSLPSLDEDFRDAFFRLALAKARFCSYQSSKISFVRCGNVRLPETIRKNASDLGTHGSVIRRRRLVSCRSLDHVLANLLINAIQTLDRPVIVAHLIVIVLLFVVLNLIVDVLYTVLDPRVHVARSTA